MYSGVCTQVSASRQPMQKASWKAVFHFPEVPAGNDDSVVLGDLAQAGDQEFPADDNDGDPERHSPGGRQVDESRGRRLFYPPGGQ